MNKKEGYETKRKLLSAFLAVCLFCTVFGFTANAAVSSEQIPLLSLPDNPIYVVVDGKSYETDASHLDNLLNKLGISASSTVKNPSTVSSKFNSAITNSIASSSVYATSPNFYFEKCGYFERCTKYDLKRRITAVAYNDSLDNMSRTLSFSFTQSYSCNSSITGVQPYIEASLGFSLTYSAYSQDSMTITIRPGYHAWFDYTPIMSNVYGYFCMQQWVPGVGNYVKREYYDLYTPRYINGMADGIYAPRTELYEPSY